MRQLQKIRKLPLKTVYYLSFFFLIVIPILTVLNVALIVLNRQFRQQALENIRQARIPMTETCGTRMNRNWNRQAIWRWSR